MRLSRKPLFSQCGCAHRRASAQAPIVSFWKPLLAALVTLLVGGSLHGCNTGSASAAAPPAPRAEMEVVAKGEVKDRGTAD